MDASFISCWLTGSSTANEAEVAPDAGDATMQVDQGSIQVKSEEQRPEGGVPEAARAAPAISPPQAVLGTGKWPFHDVAPTIVE